MKDTQGITDVIKKRREMLFFEGLQGKMRDGALAYVGYPELKVKHQSKELAKQEVNSQQQLIKSKQDGAYRFL